jgi:hypothetical protein
MSDDAQTILKHEAELTNGKSNFMTWWQDICYRVLPAEAQFTTINAEGEKRTERLFDSNGAKANRKHAAILEDLATPRSQRWHGVAAEDDSLTEDQETDEYFDKVTGVLFAMRDNPKSMFYANRSKNYLLSGAVGNTALFVDEVPGDGSRYLARHMRGITWAEDEFGQIDTLYDRFPMQGRNALKRFGDQLSEKLRADIEKAPYKNFEFIHCTRPNEERVTGRRDYRGMKWASYYVSVDDKAVVSNGGFWEWPWAISRYNVAVGEVYGRSPAMECWPSIMTLQEQKKTILRVGQKEADPPILCTEEGVLGQFSLRAGDINYGALSDNGTPLAMPFKTGANVPLGLELMQLEKADVDDSFLSALWNMIVNENVQTAAQVFELARMRAINLAPLMGRMHSEDLGPLIHREIGIASRSGKLPPMPRRLRAMGGRYNPVYTSPLAKAMRAQDGLAIVRTLEVLPTAIAVDKRAANAIKVTEAVRELADIQGMPAKFIRSLEEIDAISKQQDEAERAASVASVAPDMSQAALNAAKAEQLRMGGV